MATTASDATTSVRPPAQAGPPPYQIAEVRVPVRGSPLALGKSLGGATVAGFQAVIVLCLAGLVGVPYAAGLLALVFVLQLLLAFAITAFGVMVAARITQMQSFMALMQMAIM